MFDWLSYHRGFNFFSWNTSKLTIELLCILLKSTSLINCYTIFAIGILPTSSTKREEYSCWLHSLLVSIKLDTIITRVWVSSYEYTLEENDNNANYWKLWYVWKGIIMIYTLFRFSLGKKTDSSIWYLNTKLYAHRFSLNIQKNMPSFILLTVYITCLTQTYNLSIFVLRHQVYIISSLKYLLVNIVYT